MPLSISDSLTQITKRPIAHRGLHNAQKGIIENSTSAIFEAIKGGFGIEIDLRQTADGIPIVFHDEKLDRLTNGIGFVKDHSVKQLKALNLKGSTDKIQTFTEFLEQVQGKTPIVIEIKSQWSKNRDFEKEICAALKNYQGVFAIMSFDKDCIKAIKRHNPNIACGLIAERFTNKAYWQTIKPFSRFELFKMRHLSPVFWQNPTQQQIDFIAYNINHLPAIPPWITKNILKIPLLTWTVRTQEQQKRAAKWADVIIFEGFTPS